MTKFKPIDYDIIYLSYDEPNAEKNYADLCKKVPWAKRVHGVEGSDAAHKACARLSETDRFITVDGDNRIREDFLNQVIDFDEHADLKNTVISWCGRNEINGLMYGNGGLKCWPKDYVLNMRTHENADPNNAHAQVDFCWDAKYIQMNSCYSDVYNNETAAQAWRAGFREGVKLATDRGVRIEKEEFKNNEVFYFEFSRKIKEGPNKKEGKKNITCCLCLCVDRWTTKSRSVGNLLIIKTRPQSNNLKS